LSSRNNRLSCVQATSSSLAAGGGVLGGALEVRGLAPAQQACGSLQAVGAGAGVWPGRARSAAASSGSVWLQLQIRVFIGAQVVGSMGRAPGVDFAQGKRRIMVLWVRRLQRPWG
jgi:hypothetical protein